MLGEIEANVGLFSITAKPESRRHRVLWGFVPYIQGEKIQFRIVVTALGDLLADTGLYYTVENNGGLMSHVNGIQQFPMKRGQKASWLSVKIPLYRTGDSFFSVWETGHVSERQDAFLFHTTSRNTVFLTVIGIIVTGLVAFFTIA
ncbi:MAG: hypothetical protein Q7R34_11375 [Dehalococcoidia bacterium]|nr:hypothetical protein [Dehalococcoidia bacterium]